MPENDIGGKAKYLIDLVVGPWLGAGDRTKWPIFPEGRNDVCVVCRTVENGVYGYDTIYLVWKTKDGELKHRELTNSAWGKDYIHIEDVHEEKGNIVIKVGSGGTMSGKEWDLTFEIPLTRLENNMGWDDF